jgi:cell division protein FtsA
MSKRSLITSIDVGTTKVCTTIADMDESGSIRVVGVGIAPSVGLHKGLVVNISEARDSVRESVRTCQLAE